MSIPPIQSVPAVTGEMKTAPAATGSDFRSMVSDALKAVSGSEAEADKITEAVASGGDAEIHDMMIAVSKAELSVDLLVQVRNRAIEAYQEIMRMQI